MESIQKRRILPCYAIVFGDMILDNRISKSSIITFTVIYMMSNFGKYPCILNNKDFKERLNISDRQIRNHLNQLQKCGYIKIISKENKRLIIPTLKLNPIVENEMENFSLLNYNIQFGIFGED